MAAGVGQPTVRRLTDRPSQKVYFLKGQATDPLPLNSFKYSLRRYPHFLECPLSIFDCQGPFHLSVELVRVRAERAPV